MRLEIVFRVDYDESSIKDKKAHRDRVEAEAMIAVGSGLLTTEDEAVVDSYQLRVEWKR